MMIKMLGTLSDFITPNQRPKYLGVDISKEAVRIAKSKREDLHFKSAGSSAI